jgi:hypothetical protein
VKRFIHAAGFSYAVALNQDPSILQYRELFHFGTTNDVAPSVLHNAFGVLNQDTVHSVQAYANFPNQAK